MVLEYSILEILIIKSLKKKVSWWLEINMLKPMLLSAGCSKNYSISEQKTYKGFVISTALRE